MANRRAAVASPLDPGVPGAGMAQRYVDLGDLTVAQAVVSPPANAPATALTDGQIAVTITAAPLQAAPGTACADIVLQNDPSSAQTVYVGTAAQQTTPLAPGQTRSLIEVGLFALSTAAVYVRTATGTATLNWLATNATGGAVQHLGTSAQQLASSACAEVIVHNDITSPANVLIGGADSQHIVLSPGAHRHVQVSNANLLYVAAASGSTSTVYWQARSPQGTTGGTVQAVPGSTNGWIKYPLTALSNTPLAVKASAGLVGGWYLFNPNSTAVYVMLYDAAAGSVTPGSGVFTPLPIPAGSAANVLAAIGVEFDTAITVVASTSSSGNSAPVMPLVGAIFYK